MGEGMDDGVGDLVDILLCEHHYRESAERLAEIGAIAIGNDGHEIEALYPPTVRMTSERLPA